MSSKRTLATAIVWIVASVVYAWAFVASRIVPHAAPTWAGCVGYECDWDFQLLAFAVVRLPFLVLALVVALWLVRRTERPRQARPG